jgi:hypothetical protein
MPDETKEVLATCTITTTDHGTGNQMYCSEDCRYFVHDPMVGLYACDLFGELSSEVGISCVLVPRSNACWLGQSKRNVSENF